MHTFTFKLSGSVSFHNFALVKTDCLIVRRNDDQSDGARVRLRRMFFFGDCLYSYKITRAHREVE